MGRQGKKGEVRTDKLQKSSGEVLGQTELSRQDALHTLVCLLASVKELYD